MLNSSHYSFGKITIKHRHKTTSIAAGSKGFDLTPEDFAFNFSTEIAYVIPGYEHRPDLISNVFYNTPEFWWLILLYNSIDDPFEGLNVGDQIKIPNI